MAALEIRDTRGKEKYLQAVDLTSALKTSEVHLPPGMARFACARDEKFSKPFHLSSIHALQDLPVCRLFRLLIGFRPFGKIGDVGFCFPSENPRLSLLGGRANEVKSNNGCHLQRIFHSFDQPLVSAVFFRPRLALGLGGSTWQRCSRPWAMAMERSVLQTSSTRFGQMV